jgi:hypothetical protein
LRQINVVFGRFSLICWYKHLPTSPTSEQNQKSINASTSFQLKAEFSLFTLKQLELDPTLRYLRFSFNALGYVRPDNIRPLASPVIEGFMLGDELLSCPIRG